MREYTIVTYNNAEISERDTEFLECWKTVCTRPSLPPRGRPGNEANTKTNLPDASTSLESAFSSPFPPALMSDSFSTTPLSLSMLQEEYVEKYVQVTVVTLLRKNGVSY